MSPATPPGLTVFERGWLSSNNILAHGKDDEGATLIDSSHCLHAAQTVALVRHALRPGQTLARVVNTHLHSDHCGGNAALVREFGAGLVIPPGQWHAVQHWDDEALSYRPTGQRCERFVANASLEPGQSIATGSRTWQALAAPGHDPHSLILFDAHDGVLISADALWENGFGIVFPELEGEPGFKDVGAVLDMIERLPVRLIVPGHGAPFTDVPAALARARSRLAAFTAEPRRHARHGAKVLLKYHLMELREQALGDLCAWAEHTPLIRAVWQAHGRGEAAVVSDWAEQLTNELVASGALRRDGKQVLDA